MLRIAHISDLHIRSKTMDNENRSLLQEIAAFLGQKMGIEVEAGGHDEEKLIALKNRLVGLKPDIIVVTGDLTNFGDSASFRIAIDYLKELKQATQARRVLCVPGNHDCLIERIAEAKRELGWVKRSLLWLVQLVNREVASISIGAKREFTASKWSSQKVVKLLQNYRCLVEEEFGACDPGKPVELDAGWGKVAFFLFNSVNEPGLMANKGRIGIEQFNRLNMLAQDPQRWQAFAEAARVALLHHHPIGAPRTTEGDISRFYDWMDDGPRFLWALNKRQFDLVLHGHQHEPFTCAISYGQADEPNTFLVAAGSATQGSMKGLRNSFNVIDLVSPFEAIFERYDMDVTGYSDSPADKRIVSLRQIDRVSVSLSGKEDTVEDWAIRKLVRSSGQEYIDLGIAYHYDMLEFDVAIDKTQIYRGRYRRKGLALSASGAAGPIFVITGSPEMITANMKLKGFDNINKESLHCEVLKDSPNRKIIQVKPRTAVAVGQAIDVALEFEWQASKIEQNKFDAVNLMSFRHPVALLKYQVRIPWQPHQIQVQSIGLNTKNLVPTVSKGPARVGSDDWEYSFVIKNPAPLVYMIRFSP